MFSKRLIASAALALIAGTAGLSIAPASAHGPDTYIDQMFGKGFTKEFMKDAERTLDKRHAYKKDDAPDWSMPGYAWNRDSFLFDFNRNPCAPVYDQDWVWYPTRGWVLETVKVGEKCGWQPFGFLSDW